ncbi:MAG TPA: hypothetical protein VJ246_02635 [Patescibacteria group bacterium]|nr:hypothetical protein [Patescibacteria group bacterium]
MSESRTLFDTSPTRVDQALMEKFSAWINSLDKSDKVGLVVGNTLVIPVAGKDALGQREGWKIGFFNAIRETIQQADPIKVEETRKTLQALVDKAQEAGITKDELRPILAELRISTTAGPQKETAPKTPTQQEYVDLLARFNKAKGELQQSAELKQKEYVRKMGGMQVGALIDGAMAQPNSPDKDRQIFQEIDAFLTGIGY